jgi:hypothetical protein
VPVPTTEAVTSPAVVQFGAFVTAIVTPRLPPEEITLSEAVVLQPLASVTVTDATPMGRLDAVDVVAPLDQMYVNGEAPTAETDAVALVEQVACVSMDVTKTGPCDCEILNDTVAEHPAAFLTTTVCAPVDKLVAVGVVWPLSQRYVFVPVPCTETEADPLVVHVLFASTVTVATGVAGD